METHNSEQLQFLVLKRHLIPEANLAAQTSLTTPNFNLHWTSSQKRKLTQSLGWREASVKGREASILVFVFCFVSFVFFLKSLQ